MRRVPVPDHIYKYAARLVRKTRPARRHGAGLAQAAGELGCRAAGRAEPDPRRRARAALSGSYMVRLEDVQQVALPVLTHRLITTFAAQAEGLSAKEIVRRLVEESTDEE